ncbi:MAG: hypothetical protein JZU55_05465, partial [Afipia sp.]|nr:hypothetical protein [Afipia sp.]
NREIRAKIGGPAELPQIRFPVSPKVKEIAGLPATFGYGLGDIEQIPDPLFAPVCLPPGFGNPGCGLNWPVTPIIDRFKNLDLFTRIESTQDPVPINRVDRQFQIDIGWRPIEKL